MYFLTTGLVLLVLLFLVWLTYKSRGRFFLPETVYMVYLSIKLQFYFKPQLNWIKANIGKMYITEEVVKHIHFTVPKNSWFHLDLRLQSAIIDSILKIPKDEFIDLTPIWLIENKRNRHLMESALRDSHLPKDEAKGLQEWVAAVHRNPSKYKIYGEYDLK